MTQYITPSKEIPDLSFNSGALSNLPFYNSLQFFNYVDNSGYIDFDTSGVYFKELHANEKPNDVSGVLFIGNQNIDLCNQEITITNSIQPSNKDFTIFLEAYPDDLSGPYTLLQFTNADENKENPRLYLENEVLHFGSIEASGQDILDIPLDISSINQKQLRMILSYQAKTSLLVGEIERPSDGYNFEFRINSRNYGYNNFVLGTDISNNNIFVGHYRTLRKFDEYFDQTKRSQLFERENRTLTNILANYIYEPDLSQYQTIHIDFTNQPNDFKPGISDISHYIFDNELDTSGYYYTSHSHTGDTFYSFDLSSNTSNSFAFETTFKHNNNANFVLYQSNNLIIFIYNKQLRIYTNSNGLLSNTVNIKNNELLDKKVIYNCDEGKLFLDSIKEINNVELIKQQMEIVREKHTYINRINDLLEVLKIR